MIKDESTLYVTVAISRDPDGSIGILLPGYAQRTIVRSDPKLDGGHHRLHVGLDWLLKENIE